MARQTSRCGGAFSSFALIPMLAGAGNNVDISTLGSQAVGGGGVAGAIVTAIVGDQKQNDA